MEEQQKVTTLRLTKTPRIEDMYGQAREVIEDVQLYMENSGMFDILGVHPYKTFLFAGEKGTGKTMGIQALNNSMNKAAFTKYARGEKIDADDYSLCVFPYDVGKYGTAYINMSSRFVQDFFDKAGLMAQLGRNVLVMLDEADALLSSRTGGLQTHSEDRKTLETIMKNLQVVHDTPNMYAVLITNLPEGCDDAALRAGRIDKKYEFKLPDKKTRRHAFEQHVGKINERAGYRVVRPQDYKTLAEMSEGFNFADIVASIEGAVRDRAVKLCRTEATKLIRAPYVSQSGLEKSVSLHAESFVGKKTRRRIGF